MNRVNRTNRIRTIKRSVGRIRATCVVITLLAVMSGCSSGGNDGSSTGLAAPMTYSAYSGTDAKAIPSAPALGPANSIINDPTFGSRILRVTDANTAGGQSLIPEDAGYFRTWNATSSALKLMNTNGTSYWAEFDSVNFQVGGLHRLNIDYEWEWSATDPNSLYFLNGSQLSRYNIATDGATTVGATYNGDPVAFHVAVVGHDNWVCSAAGNGGQDTYTKLFCANPSTSETKLIDVVNRTINGVAQSDPNWPTAASGQTLGIHLLFGSTGGTWLGVVFVQASWNPNGDAVLNLTTNTWSLKTSADQYWNGHENLGNGRYLNASGSRDGRDSRGAVLRDPDNLMDSTQYSFILQPPSTVGWYDADHSSWFNSSTTPGAPILFSRYNTATPPEPIAWYGEIVLAATDGSNTVWRFAHNHNAGGSFYAQAFAQISNDGRWALFSSIWDGALGGSNGDFGLSSRLDTFIVELR